MVALTMCCLAAIASFVEKMAAVFFFMFYSVLAMPFYTLGIMIAFMLNGRIAKGIIVIALMVIYAIIPVVTLYTWEIRREAKAA